MQKPINIVIDTPLCELSELGVIKEEYTVYETNRNLADLLVKYEFIKSKSELRRNRPDLLRTLDKPDFERIKIGKNIVWVITGIQQQNKISINENGYAYLDSPSSADVFKRFMEEQ